MPKVTAIVLAAGLSRRMGDENKLFLKYKGEHIVDHVIRKIKKSNVDELVIVGSELSLKQLEKHCDSKTKLIDNKDYKSGMTSSIKAGVEATYQTDVSTDGYMICLGDQPLIQQEVYDEVVNTFRKQHAINDQVIIVPFFENNKGNPVLFSSCYKKAILENYEPEGCKNIVRENSNHVVRLSVSDSGILADIDTPEDYKGLKR